MLLFVEVSSKSPYLYILYPNFGTHPSVSSSSASSSSSAFASGIHSETSRGTVIVNTVSQKSLENAYNHAFSFPLATDCSCRD